MPLKISISFEAWWESRLDQVMHPLEQEELNQYLQNKAIGSGLNEIFILLVCRQPVHNFKQRIRHSKKSNVLSLDLMLDLPTFMRIDHAARRFIIASKIIDEVPAIVQKYKFKDVNVNELKIGLAEYFSQIKWITDTAYNTSVATTGQ